MGDLTMKKALTLFSSADDSEDGALLKDENREFV